jgi:ribonuclease R
VPLGALGGDFTVDQNKTKATRAGGGTVLSIGDWVKVEIIGVDEDLRRVSGWIVEARAQDGKGKAVSFTPSLAAPMTLREGDFVQERRSDRWNKQPGEGSGPKKPTRRGRDASGPAAPAGDERPARKPHRGQAEKPPATGRPPARTKLPKGSVRTGGPKRSTVTGFGTPQPKRRKP